MICIKLAGDFADFLAHFTGVVTADVLLKRLAGVPGDVQVRLHAQQLAGSRIHGNDAAWNRAGDGGNLLASLGEDILVTVVHTLRNLAVLLLAKTGEAAVHVVVQADGLSYLLTGGFSLCGEDAGIVGFIVLLHDGGVSAFPVGTCAVAAVMAYVERLITLGGGSLWPGNILVRVHVHGSTENVFLEFCHKVGVFFLGCGHQGQHQGDEE